MYYSPARFVVKQEKRESWGNFRMTNWAEAIDYPKLTLQQTQGILVLTA